jgi:hypothetical protein
MENRTHRTTGNAPTGGDGLEDVIGAHEDIRYPKHQLHRYVSSRVRGATIDHRIATSQEFTLLPRSMQKWSDLLRRKPSDRFAIDDDSFGWASEAGDKLVLTKGVFG